MTDEINEGPLSGVGRMAANFGKRAVNAFGAAMGSTAAKGNLKLDDARKDMWARWHTYSKTRGIGQDEMPYGLATFFAEVYGQQALQMFTDSLAQPTKSARDPKEQQKVDAALAKIKEKFGVEPKGNASPANTTQAAAPQQSTPPQQAGVPQQAAKQPRVYGDQRDVGKDARARGDASADTKAAMGDVMRMFGSGTGKTPYDNYQIRTMTKVLSATRQPQLDKNAKAAVFSLAKELIASANERGEGEKKRVLTFLRRLEKEPELVQKMPNLIRLSQSAGRAMGVKESHEPLMLAIGLARILIEHQVRTPAALNEALNIAVADRVSVLEAAYDRAYLDALFLGMTQGLFRAGVIQHPDDVENPVPNQQNQQQGSQQQGAKGGFNVASQIKDALNKLPNIKPEIVNAIYQAALKVNSIDDLEATLDQQGVAVSPKVWSMVQKQFK